MILLDTHLWVWWVNGSSELSDEATRLIRSNENDGIAVSIISCWEVAKKVEVGKLALDRDVADWIESALAYPGVRLIDLTPRIVVESTRLPQPLHRDPADQLIVATSRVLGVPLLTADERLIRYEHVVKATGQR